jgi:glucokinase
MPSWRAFPLRERLSELFPGLPVRVHNDAVAVAVGEHWRGAGRGRPNVLGMVVSTGVGGGLILGDRIINGKSGNAGHIGHVIVDPDGPACECGGRGCLEAIARGPGLSAWAREQGWTGETGKELAHDAARGHPVAVRAMNRAGWALGVAIASATHLCDLDVVAVGGGLSQAGPLLFRPLEDTFRAHAQMDFAREVRVVPAALGQMAGLVGAAAFIFAADRYWTGD